MFGGIPIKDVVKNRKLHSSLVKTAKGKVDRQTAVDTLTFSYLVSLYNLETHLYNMQKSFIDYVNKFDETQSCMDDIAKGIGSAELGRTLMELHTTDFSETVERCLFNLNIFEERFDKYVLLHYLRVTDPDVSYVKGVSRFMKDVADNPHYEQIWNKVLDLMHSVSRGTPFENDTRIFMPEPGCILNFFKLCDKIHMGEDCGFKMYNRYGEVTEIDGTPICISRVVFPDQAQTELLPGDEFLAENLPHFNFHGKYEEAPLKPLNYYSIDQFIDYTVETLWDKSLVHSDEIALKNGDLLPKVLKEKVAPDQIICIGERKAD
ncbi:MAG: hypothetical protein ACI4CS_11820 [Candidatus Weimeria sp.]